MDTKYVFFCSAFKKSYEAQRADSKGILFSILKGIRSFFCGFKVSVVEKVSQKMLGGNGDSLLTNSSLANQYPKNPLNDEFLHSAGIHAYEDVGYAEISEFNKVVEDSDSVSFEKLPIYSVENVNTDQKPVYATVVKRSERESVE